MVKANKDSLAVEFATYLGSLGTTLLTGIAIGGDGQPVLLGATTTAGFPFSPGSYDPPELAPDTRSVAFLAKMNGSGTSLTYAARLFALQDGPVLSSVSLSGTRLVADGTGVATVFDGPSRSPLRVWKLTANGASAVFAKSIPGWASVESLALLPDGSYLLGGVDTGLAPLGPDSVIPRGLGSSSGLLALIRLDPTASQVLSARLIPGGTPIVAVSASEEEYVAVRSDSFGQTFNSFPVTPGAIRETSSNLFASAAGILRLARVGTCSATVAPGFDLVIPVSGGSGLIPIEAPPNCTWVAGVDSAGWMSLISSVTGTGNGSLPYNAASLGPAEAGRRATLTLSNGAPVVLTQGQPAACPAATLDLADVLGVPLFGQPWRVSPAGGNFAGAVNPSPGCPWTISSQADWITISPVLSGTGRASIAVQISRNDGPARAGAIRLNNVNLLVNQDACAYTALLSVSAFPGISGTLPSFRAAAGAFAVNTSPSCGWSVSSSAAWFRLSGDTNMRAGSGTVRFAADENPLTTARVATVTVGTANLSFSQPGRDCLLTINSPSQTVPAAGGTVNMSTTSSSNNCSTNFIATPPATNFFGTGGLQGSATMVVPANTSPIPRAFRASVGRDGGLMSIPFMQEGVNTPAPFTDVPTNHPFLNHITLVKDRGIDRGCSVDGQRYCSETAMTRAEMAGFLSRAGTSLTDVSLPAGVDNPPLFEDVPATHPYFRAIQAIRATGITVGCSTRPARYCPDAPVTRGEMAAFIVRAVLRTDDFDYDGTPYFQDVPATHPFFRHIQRLRNLGITVGCGNGNFCPNDTNTRGQMAAFIVRAFLSGLFN
ncbi:MAG: S-layer homology domain-containing protein [Bryobacterales bacterium]|nr:S-layer homology domain-containing protein [Bryobacterales bacterium]